MENCNNVSKVPYDPGWNDPPTFSYNAQQTTTPGRPRNFLNKRVAFPLSGTGNTPAAGSTPPVNLPPLPTAPPIPIPNSQKPAFETTNNENIDSESVLIEVKTILLEFLDSSSELGSKSNDIKKRIGVMEEMWSSGKLNTQIQVHMKDLAHALKDDQPSKADDIHRALMVDYVSVVGTWMPGVKQLVHHCIARSELLAIDKE
ncbi:steroid receptor RNA activator 1-like [Pectinophora gossypiella]|uniref:SRA1/Sec31 domain-containing protein n=1 Tax=Pectinophora gossypiella TaxID=13191 RepID=A0A1E1WMZ2_PECGO|nr:steroid receptor RNA activator 1-like [Pectinophora gossypiella]